LESRSRQRENREPRLFTEDYLSFIDYAFRDLRIEARIEDYVDYCVESENVVGSIDGGKDYSVLLSPLKSPRCMHVVKRVLGINLNEVVRSNGDEIKNA
jgi:hypothetical protein